MLDTALIAADEPPAFATVCAGRRPVVFVCENNRYMEYTPIEEVTAVQHPAADRASAYGLEPILIDGNDVTRWPPADRQIGYVPQDLALFPTMTVRENLEFALQLRRAPRPTASASRR